MLQVSVDFRDEVAELHGFLEDAGFVDCDAAPSFGYYWLVSGRKPALAEE